MSNYDGFVDTSTPNHNLTRRKDKFSRINQLGTIKDKENGGIGILGHYLERSNVIQVWKNNLQKRGDVYKKLNLFQEGRRSTTGE